jgi:hypothetical protein
MELKWVKYLSENYGQAIWLIGMSINNKEKCLVALTPDCTPIVDVAYGFVN